MSDSEKAPSKPPTPPPLPPTPHRNHERPSPFLAKLASAPKDWLSQPIEDTGLATHHYEPIYYFFYGTLASPDVVKSVLDLKTEPELREAKVIGYSLSLWGQYKALIDGDTDQEVFGRGFWVQSPEDEFKLAYYETNAYELAPCTIYFMDGNEPAQVFGRTFMYAGDAEALKDARFDRKLWELQMGMRLPPRWRKGSGKAEVESEQEASM